MRYPPTREMSRCLQVIRDLTLDGVPPSFGELSERLGVGKSGVHHRLMRMKERGLIDFLPRQSRTLRIIEPPPLLGGLSLDALHTLRSNVEAEITARTHGSRL